MFLLNFNYQKATNDENNVVRDKEENGIVKWKTRVGTPVRNTFSKVIPLVDYSTYWYNLNIVLCDH